MLLGPSCLDAASLTLLCSSQPTSFSFPEDDFHWGTWELIPLILTLSGFSQRKRSLLLHPGYCFPYLCSGFHTPACSGLFCGSWLSPQCLQPPPSLLCSYFLDITFKQLLFYKYNDKKIKSPNLPGFGCSCLPSVTAQPRNSPLCFVLSLSR